MSAIFQNLNNYNTTYATLLFPAMPLMMITFSNRYNTLSLLIKRIHNCFINKKILSIDKSAMRYLSQLKILNIRLRHTLYIKILSGIFFIFNLLSILYELFNLIRISIFFFHCNCNNVYCSYCSIRCRNGQAGKSLKTHLE